jgi:outer membrane biosynthesis protein TonB
MKLNRRGLTGTIIYHALLVLLLVFAGLTFPEPPPEEEGILVNFGTDETGFGDYEPSGDDQQAGEPDLPMVEESMEIPEQEAAPVNEPAETPTPPDPRPEEQTQDVEETKVKEEPQPTPEELERQRQADLERQRQAELERQRQAELERQRQAELEQERIERERREEEERIAREQQQKAERLNNAGRSAFGRQGVGETASSEGVTEGSGNQGVTAGSPDADRYDTGGGLGDGISFGGLGSRRGNLPKPNLSDCDVTQKIEITVDIQVDRDGTVVSAIVKSGTYQDKCIWDMVVAAAKKSRFSPDQNADYRQTGWIRYIIVP